MLIFVEKYRILLNRIFQVRPDAPDGCLPPWVRKVTTEDTAAWKRGSKACAPAAAGNLLEVSRSPVRRLETPAIRALLEAQIEQIL